jgi:hypothetical protein
MLSAFFVLTVAAFFSHMSFSLLYFSSPTHPYHFLSPKAIVDFAKYSDSYNAHDFSVLCLPNLDGKPELRDDSLTVSRLPLMNHGYTRTETVIFN